MTTRVLVLDANQRSALAITRSLGKDPNITVLTADHTDTALAGASRFSSQYLKCPSPEHEPGAFIDWLTAILKVHGIKQLFPATEISSYLCLMHREQLLPCQLPFPALDTVLSLADKGRLVALARRLGVPHPESRLVIGAEQFDPNAIDRYPVILKPCLSRRWIGNGWLSTSVHLARSREEARRLIETLPYLRHHPFMVQAFIPGSGAGVFALYNQGKAVTFFAHKRLREKPPTGGVSVLSESAPLDPRLLDMSRRLLDHAQWHGVAMVEFRVTPEGEPYLMEVNPRFWGSLQLAIDCGLDFPHLLFEMGQGETPTPPANYPIGRRLRWLLGDLDSLYLTLRNSRDFTKTQRLRRALAFPNPGLGTTRYEVNRLGDLGPARYELVQYFRDLLRLNR